MKKMFSAAIGYLLVTFPLGFIWHLVLFKSVYESFGLYQGRPKFSLGILSMIIQGFVLASLYSVFPKNGSRFGSAFKFCMLMGLFFASGTVIALAAKAQISNLPLWFGYNLTFTFIHFSLVADAAPLRRVHETPQSHLHPPTSSAAFCSAALALAISRDAYDERGQVDF